MRLLERGDRETAIESWRLEWPGRVVYRLDDQRFRLSVHGQPPFSRRLRSCFSANLEGADVGTRIIGGFRLHPADLAFCVFWFGLMGVIGGAFSGAALLVWFAPGALLFGVVLILVAWRVARPQRAIILESSNGILTRAAYLARERTSAVARLGRLPWPMFPRAPSFPTAHASFWLNVSVASARGLPREGVLARSADLARLAVALT